MRLKLLLTPRDNLLSLLFAVNIIIISACQGPPAEKPNVLLIMIDDLNDCIELFKGHPQSLTPNINKLAKSGTSFLNAHTNAPMCGPRNPSMERWDFRRGLGECKGDCFWSCLHKRCFYSA